MAARTKVAATVDEVQRRLDAARPLVVGGLATLVVLHLTADTSAIHGSLRTLEHAILLFLVAELALDIAVTDGSLGDRWLEAGVLVPYILLVGGAFLAGVVGCGLPAPAGPAAGLFDWLHETVVVCRELVALDVVAGVGVAANARELLEEAVDVDPIRDD
ncbi:hypothetical protein [Halosegnis sp.]|uniref:hypothetical protein n=1 Tax=Halosegnis sp. TaxID=2864959 RepID=UPI0035D4BF23